MCSNIVEKKGSVFSCRKGESRNFENTQQNIKFVYWLMKNEVAHSTHYQSLIDLCTDFDESGVVATWQKNRGDNATYRSSAISTQLLKAIGQYIDDSVVDSVCSSSILAIMCDKATDLRNRTELSICIQYL